jgi:hypothetical protein
MIVYIKFCFYESITGKRFSDKKTGKIFRKKIHKSLTIWQKDPRIPRKIAGIS